MWSERLECVLRESTVGGVSRKWGVGCGPGVEQAWSMEAGGVEAWQAGLASLSVGPTTPKAGATRSWAEQKPATSAVLQCCVSAGLSRSAVPPCSVASRASARSILIGALCWRLTGHTQRTTPYSGTARP